MATTVASASLRDAVFEQLRDPILVVDTQGILLDLNPAAARVLALDSRAALRQPLSELLRHIPAIPECLRAAATGVRSIALPSDMGRSLYACSATALQDPDGTPVGTLLQLTEVADLVGDAADSPDMYIVVNPVSRTICECNGMIANALGYTRQELIGQPTRFLFKPAFYARLEQLGIRAGIETGCGETADVLLQRKDGTYLNASMTSVPMHDASDHPLFVYTTFRDITERKRVEKALRIALAKYAVLFDLAATGISITDVTGKILESNRAAERILGVPRQEHENRTFDSPEWSIIRPDGTPMPTTEYPSVRALSENRPIENVAMGVVKGPGSVAWISVNAAPIALEGYGVVITYHEIADCHEGVSG